MTRFTDLAHQEKEQGNLCYERNDMEGALRHFNKAIALDPLNYIYYSNRSMVLMRLKRLDEALADTNRVVILNPMWPKVRSAHACAGAHAHATHRTHTRKRKTRAPAHTCAHTWCARV